MKKKIPNFMSNRRLEGSNSTYKNDTLIIGDSEKVLDIKNQYLIETYNQTCESINGGYDEYLVRDKIKKIKDLTCARIVGEEYDSYTDFCIYPLIDIKIKGSGTRDILKKNNHAPTGFFCIHNSTSINRNHFDLYDSFYKFTKKKYLTKSIKITSSSICFFPMFNMDFPKNNPFVDLPKPFESFELDKIELFQKELNSIKKKKNIKGGNPGSIIKYSVDNGTYDVYNPIHDGDKLIFVLKK